MRRSWEDATDAELLAACHSVQEPFAVFYRRHERLVAGWLIRRCGWPDLAADLLAEVFAAAYVSAPRFRPGPEPAAAWLLGIARNLLRDSVRRARVEASARKRLELDAIELSAASATALAELEAEDPAHLLAGLPPDQRDAIRARVLEDLDYQQLADLLEVSPAAARKRVSRGLSTLRSRIQHEGADR